MHKVIINADDFGYSRGINLGIIDAHRYGVLTSTTLMATTPGFEHAVSLAKENPDLGVGVHLNLTHGYPLLKDHKTIIDPKTGRFRHRSFYETLDFKVDQDEVYREWDAQIQKVINAGIEPTHLDSHHHTHAYGMNQEVVIELARKYKLPVRNIILEIPDDIPKTERFEPGVDAAACSFQLIVKPYLDNLIEDFQKVASTEVMVHPGYLDKEVLNGSSLTKPRPYVVDFLIHSDFAQRLRNHENIALVTYRDL